MHSPGRALPCLVLPCHALTWSLALSHSDVSHSALPFRIRLALSYSALPCLTLPCLVFLCRALPCLTVLLCLTLSGLVSFYSVLPRLILPCLVLSFSVLPCLFLLSCFVSFCLALSCLSLSCLVLSYYVLPCRVLLCLVLLCLALSYSALPCPALSCLVLSYSALPYGLLVTCNVGSFLGLSKRDLLLGVKWYSTLSITFLSLDFSGLFSCDLNIVQTTCECYKQSGNAVCLVETS